MQTNLRLQPTIYGDESLPAINDKIKNGMAAKEAEAAKFRAEEQAGNEKKLAATPTSMRKRSLL